MSGSVEWVRLALDLTKFDESPFEPYLQRTAAAGIALATLAEVGDLPGHRRQLYELNKTCSADIPELGTFYSYDEYVAQRLEELTFDPCGVVLATQGDTLVGFATTSIHHAKGYAFSEMTGVVGSSGMPLLRTYHHPDNAFAISMNRRLGFVDDRQEP